MQVRCFLYPSAHPRRTKVSMDMSLEEVAGVSSVLSVECTQEPMDALTFNTSFYYILGWLSKQ